MESVQSSASAQPHVYQVRFHGAGSGFALIVLKNIFFTLITLGIYLPWAKTNTRRYLWQNTELHGHRFEYTGTGKELFRGYVKLVLAYVLGVGLIHGARLLHPNLGVAMSLSLALGFVLCIPYFIFWSKRYQLSRTRWRGIRMGLEGPAGPFAKNFITGYLLMILSLGLYYPVWMDSNYGRIVRAARFGSMPFNYVNDEKAVFKIFLKSLPLMIITLGIYYFWYHAAILRHRAEHLSFGDTRMKSSITGGEFLGIAAMGVLGMPLTLGLGFPWISMYNVRTLFEQYSFVGLIDFETIAQRASDGGIEAGTFADALDVGVAF